MPSAWFEHDDRAQDKLDELRAIIEGTARAQQSAPFSDDPLRIVNCVLDLRALGQREEAFWAELIPDLPLNAFASAVGYRANWAALDVWGSAVVERPEGAANTEAVQNLRGVVEDLRRSRGVIQQLVDM